MTANFALDVGYFRLSAELQPYFTALYYFDVRCEPGTWVEDCLHPEWAALRFTQEGPPPQACIGSGEMMPQWPFVVSGPTSQSIRFGVTRSRIWGLGLQPAGWAKFVDGRAGDFANQTLDGTRESAFALFMPIFELSEDPAITPDEFALLIDRHLSAHLHRSSPHEPQILACHEALRDPDISNVAELAERLEVSARSLERLCSRYFGFPPKQLLRRHRFLRSLAQFMLTSTRSWSQALDSQYYDQAQFVRDFRSLMGMTPSEFADTPHPILDVIMRQRMADQGAAPQTDLPTMLRYNPPR